MTPTKFTSLVLTLLIGVGAAQANEAAAGWQRPAENEVANLASLQRGARNFMAYCSGCHSLKYARYSRVAEDLKISDELRDQLLVKPGAKFTDYIRSSMPDKDATDWFGKVPPDLTLVARSRASGAGSGPDYLYTLLRSYYRDDTKPTGWNNAAFPNIGMPHPLWELQGERKPVHQKIESHGHEAERLAGWDVVKPGKMTQAEYDQNVGDLVAYLQWMAEPAAKNRVRIGVWVLIFLGFFTVVAWRLNAAYWKDVK